eukprot:1152374-Pelagomonas_calceolata.AAC.5
MTSSGVQGSRRSKPCSDQPQMCKAQVIYSCQAYRLSMHMCPREPGPTLCAAAAQGPQRMRTFAAKPAVPCAAKPCLVCAGAATAVPCQDEIGLRCSRSNSSLQPDPEQRHHTSASHCHSFRCRALLPPRAARHQLLEVHTHVQMQARLAHQCCQPAAHHAGAFGVRMVWRWWRAKEGARVRQVRLREGGRRQGQQGQLRVVRGVQQMLDWEAALGR